MKNGFNELPHKRFNILTGEWVLVSPHRTKRPWQGKKDKRIELPKVSHDPNCYLCPGNTRANGEQNPDYESTYSFINDFSALLADAETLEEKSPFFKARTEKGICKVVCFSPDHSLTLPLMSVEALTKVINLWQNEYEELGSKAFINHVQIFENKGSLMGCSNPHPHGQIWAQESIPEEVLKKQERQKAYWDKNGTSLLADYIKKELEIGERIVVENEHFVALVPYWAIWPYEIMIAPKNHYQNITQLNADEESAFASIVKKLTIRYDNLFKTSFPYSMGIHQSPTDGEQHPEWHFHMLFYPPLLRSAEIKKFMVGYEMFASPQRDITAEMAADTLKNLSEAHYGLTND